MKELSIEEKAQRYDEAIIRGSRLWECGEITRENYEYIFPGLADSEDERIRKALIKFHKATIDIDGIKGGDITAWLEKQGEQKPAVEPKFHEGDWVAINPELRFASPLCIKNIYNNNYRVESVNGDGGTPTIDYLDNHYHLWTIQDVKDGDVLCSNQIIILFKQWEDSADCNFVIAHAGIDVSGKLQITDGHWLINNNSHPATKEQRDLLFQKMKESGYEWDEIKKELKSKI